MSENRPISTLAMMRDPRLRRLFALVGLCLEGEDWGLYDNEEALRDVLLDLAPEYLPPDDPADEELMAEWQEIVDLAIGRTQGASCGRR